MGTRKLNRPTDQRLAILRNQTTALLWKGRIETTAARAKEVQSMAERIITWSMDTHDKNIMVQKEIQNAKGQTVDTFAIVWQDAQMTINGKAIEQAVPNGNGMTQAERLAALERLENGME